MKIIIIYSFMFFIAAFTGCSDDPVTTLNTGQIEKQSINKPIWQLDEFVIKATDEKFVYDILSYYHHSTLQMESFLITFECYSNADNFTNGYIPSAVIHSNGNLVYRVRNFKYDGLHLVNIDNIFLNKISFELMLALSDSPFVNSDITKILTLSNIRLYRK